MADIVIFTRSINWVCSAKGEWVASEVLVIRLTASIRLLLLAAIALTYSVKLIGGQAFSTSTSRGNDSA